MTKPKHVATTLQNIMENPVMMAILDRSSDLTEVIPVVDEYWVYDLHNRRPSPAEYDDNGNLIKATNLDLATFLYALHDRGAVINLPTYKAKGKKTVKEGQMVVSDKNRHGKIIGIVSNQDTFSFSVKIIDQNVITTDSTGAPRNFNLTDPDGSWYAGWRTINFLPDQNETKFLTENKLWSGLSVTFDNFVNPNRWISFFGQYYFLTKCMIDRLVDERKHLKSEKKRLEELGIKLPKGNGGEFEQLDAWNTKTIASDKGHGVKVKCLEVKVDTPEAINSYGSYPDTPDGLLTVRRKIKAANKALEKFRFTTRSIECAVNRGDYFESFPAWIKNVKWEEDFKESPRSRTKWRRLKLVQPGVGQRSVAIRYRHVEKTKYYNEEAAKEMNAASA